MRDRIRNDLDTTLIIEAAAGTGKTTALVNRIVAVMAGGRAELGRIVAVTFTEKAAGELKLRLRAEIERARQRPDARLARSARGSPTRSASSKRRASARSIRSAPTCCASARSRRESIRCSRSRPKTLRARLFESAFDRWFEQALGAPGEGLRRLLRRRDGFDREGPRPIIARARRGSLLQWRDFDTPWSHRPFERDREIDALVEDIRALGALSRERSADRSEDWLRRRSTRLPVRSPRRRAWRAVRGRDYDALEAALLALLRGTTGVGDWKGCGENFGDARRAPK